MSDLRQRREEIRSQAYLDGARGQPCTLEFVGVCNHDPDTTVPCHWDDETFAFAQKADDISVIDGCFACHQFLDFGWVGKISRTVLLAHVNRGLQRTLRNRVERKIVLLKLDAPKPHHDKPVKPRPPKAERRPVRAGKPLESRSSWPVGRKLPTRKATK